MSIPDDLILGHVIPGLNYGYRDLTSMFGNVNLRNKILAHLSELRYDVLSLSPLFRFRNLKSLTIMLQQELDLSSLLSVISLRLENKGTLHVIDNRMKAPPKLEELILPEVSTIDLNYVRGLPLKSLIAPVLEYVNVKDVQLPPSMTHIELPRGRFNTSDLTGTQVEKRFPNLRHLSHDGFYDPVKQFTLPECMESLSMLYARNIDIPSNVKNLSVYSVNNNVRLPRRLTSLKAITAGHIESLPVGLTSLELINVEQLDYVPPTLKTLIVHTKGNLSMRLPTSLTHLAFSTSDRSEQVALSHLINLTKLVSLNVVQPSNLPSSLTSLECYSLYDWQLPPNLTSLTLKHQTILEADLPNLLELNIPYVRSIKKLPSSLTRLDGESLETFPTLPPGLTYLNLKSARLMNPVGLPEGLKFLELRSSRCDDLSLLPSGLIYLRIKSHARLNHKIKYLYIHDDDRGDIPIAASTVRLSIEQAYERIGL